MVACPDHRLSPPPWRINNPYSGLCLGSVYLCYILIMTKSEKIIVEKAKKRIPVPRKPPKVEEDIKAYNRKKEKSKLRKKGLPGI